MIIAITLPGILLGLISAGIAVVAGYGFVIAFCAYVLGGMLGAVAGIYFAVSPDETGSSKETATQRS